MVRGERWVPVLVVVLFVAMQLPRLAVPPLGRDSWRETVGLMVGRNFCTEQAPLLSPRVDERGEKSGVTGMEFPALYWLAGRLACLGLPQVPVARGLTLLFTCLAMGCVYALGRSLRDARTGALAMVAFAWAPDIFYYGRTVQPDVPAVSLALLSLALLQRERLWWSAVAMGLGILVKLPVVVFGLPALVLMLRRPLPVLLRDARVWAWPVLALLPALLWYSHAKTLQVEGGLQTFNLGQPFAQTMRDWLSPTFWRLIFLQQLFDVYAFPAVSVLAVLGFALRRRALPGWLWAMLAASVAFFLLAGYPSAHHYYYGVVAVPVLALAGADALVSLAVRLKWPAAVLVAFAVLTAGFGVWRTWRFFAHPGDEAPYLEAKAAIDQRAPAGARVFLFSKVDPTALWFLERKGHVAPPAEEVQWLGSELTVSRPGAVVLDGSRVDGALAERLEPALRAQGFSPWSRFGHLQVWGR